MKIKVGILFYISSAAIILNILGAVIGIFWRPFFWFAVVVTTMAWFDNLGTLSKLIGAALKKVFKKT
jgi:hypothetical protein